MRGCRRVALARAAGRKGNLPTWQRPRPRYVTYVLPNTEIFAERWLLIAGTLALPGPAKGIRVVLRGMRAPRPASRWMKSKLGYIVVLSLAKEFRGWVCSQANHATLASVLYQRSSCRSRLIRCPTMVRLPPSGHQAWFSGWAYRIISMPHNQRLRKQGPVDRVALRILATEVMKSCSRTRVYRTSRRAGKLIPVCVALFASTVATRLGPLHL